MYMYVYIYIYIHTTGDVQLHVAAPDPASPAALLPAVLV